MISEDDEEEKLLKIHYQDSKRFIEIPLESNGKILSKDITCMDSRISALIIEKKDSKRMVKFKDGYIKEPKETWENVKVYAVLEENQEEKLNRVTSADNSCTDGTFNWNTRIKSEAPEVFTQEMQYNNQRGITRSLPSSSNVRNKVKIEAPEMSTTVQHTNRPIPSSTVARHSDNSSQDLTAATDDDGSNLDVKKSSYVKKASDKEYYLDEGSIESANGITVIDEPTNDELLLAYKVLSLKELKAKLCRGDFKYVSAFRDAINRFKRTMVTFPNNEFVRLIHFARSTDVMMKSLLPKTFCDLSNEDFTLKHLVSQKHANMYHRKFNADPPEVALLLNPKIYEKYIDPLILEGLKISDYKKMEESSEFSITGLNGEFFKLKYILINRIIQGKFAANSITSFSLRKILFLRKNSNRRALKTIFTTYKVECRSCRTSKVCTTSKVSRKKFRCYLLHLLSVDHLQNSLNQEEFNNICKAMSIIEETSEGYRFLTSEEVNRKRKQSSDNSQNGVKRQKMS